MLSIQSLSDRIYSNLEDKILPELNSQNCTIENIADIKNKLRQEADSIATGIVDEIQENAYVRLKDEVMILKDVVSGIIDAFINSPTVPMDGGTSFKIGLITSTVPLKVLLASILGNEKII